MGKGIVYTYGIWKPKKGKFRYIAGTRSQPKTPSSARDTPKRDKRPPRAPLYHMSKALVSA